MPDFFKKISHDFRILKDLFGKYLYLTPLIVFLGLLGSFSESIGVGALVPLFARMAKSSFAAEIDSVTKVIEKIFSTLHLQMNIYMLLIFIGAMFVVKAVAGMIIAYVTLKVRMEAENDMRQHLYKKILASRWPYLSRQKFGYLQGTLWMHVAAGASFLQAVTSLLIDTLSTIVYIGFSFFISPLFSFLTFALGALILVLSKPLFRRFKEAERKTMLYEKKMSHEINENVVGLKTIKAMNLAELVSQVVADIYEKYKMVKIKQQVLKNLVSSSFQPLGIIFMMVIFGVYSKQPGFNFATFVSVLYLIQRSFIHFERINSNLQALNSLTPHMEHLIATRQEVDRNQEQGGGLSFSFRDSFEFRNVAFDYGDSARPVLDNINFKIKKGEAVGMIGPSGSGKTTMVDIMLRLLEPKTGEVMLDGTAIKDIEFAQWCRNVGYVSQEAFLKNATIAENIAFYDSTITHRDIEEAARMSGIFDFVMSLPKRFDTVVEDRGINFSGGQRQKIVLARVLARKPKILVLDEATSALDAESEQEVKQALDALRGKVTIVVVAHRLSTVLGCDRIIALENGTIREQGRPGDLLEDKQSYLSRIYELGSSTI